MNTLISQLKIKFKELTFKKIVISTIILICFILFVRIMFKNNILEGFQQKTLEDISLIKYELREFADIGSEKDGQIVWDNRIYLLQPSKKNEPKFSFWNINNSDKLDYVNDENNIVKSLGTNMNTMDNDTRPSKPAMVVTKGKYKTYEKYIKVTEVGSDEFTKLKFDYNYLKEQSIDEIAKIKEDCDKKLTTLNKLKEYFEQFKNYDNLFTQDNEDVEKFVNYVLMNTIMYEYAYGNPTSGFANESPNLYNIIKNYNGVYQSEKNLGKEGVGKPVAFSRIPFGTTLSLFSSPNYIRSGTHVDLTVPYETNTIYEDKLYSITVEDDDTAEGFTSMIQARNEADIVEFETNMRRGKLIYDAKKIIHNQNLYRPYSMKYYDYGNAGADFGELRNIKVGINEGIKIERARALLAYKEEKTPNNAIDIEHSILPHSYHINKWSGNLRAKFDFKWKEYSWSDIKHKDKNNIEFLRTKGYIESNIIFDNNSPPKDFGVPYTEQLQSKSSSNNTALNFDNNDMRKFLRDHDLRDIYYDLKYVDLGSDLSGLPSILANMNSYKNETDEAMKDLDLVAVDFNYYESPNEVYLLNIGQADFVKLDEIKDLSDLDNINNYLKEELNLTLDNYTNWYDFEEDTITDNTKKLKYLMFNYQIHPYHSNDNIIKEVVSWQFNVNDFQRALREDIFKQVKRYINKLQYNDTFQQEITTKIDNLQSNYEKIEMFTRFIEKLQKNIIPFPSLKVIRPIAPSGYKNVGDVIMSSEDFIRETSFDSSVKTSYGDNEKDYITYQLQRYVAVPETCIKEVREWRQADKIYQFKHDGKTLNFYRNPYINTIRVTTSNKPPDGYIEKLVACVEECDAVESLIKTDECAKKLYQTKTSIEGGTSVMTNIADDEENKYYINKIKSRTSYIKDLSDKARDLQLKQDKNILINREYNRFKLQNYVDDQSRNISILTDKLKNGMKKVDMNLYMYPDNITQEQIKDNTGMDITTKDGQVIPIIAEQVGSRQRTTNTVIKMIDNTTLPQDTKNDLKNKVSDYQMMMDNQLISPDEYNNRVTKVLESCPEYDLSGLVKKDTIADVCYGCDI